MLHRRMLHRLVVFGCAVLMALSALVRPTPVMANSPSSPSPETSPGEGLRTGPVCDDRLLDELSMHIRGLECINTFDHSCWRLYAMISGAIGSTMAATGGVAQLVDNRSQRAMSVARHQIARDNRIGANSEQFKRKYAQFVNPQEFFRDGRVISKDQVRLTALRSMERLASDRSLAAVQTARAAALRSMTASGLRGGALMYAGALASGAGAALFAIGFVMSATPAGDCNDNGFAYIDYRMSNGRCEMSFAVSGLKVRGFFQLPREKQLATLLNDAPTCEYYHLLNEHLRGNLVSEVELMNQVSFSQMPSCRAGGGVIYQIDIAGTTQTVRSQTDPETKRIRHLTLGQPNPGSEVLRDQVRVFYQDSGDGSRPYRIESTNVFNNPIELDFEGFLSAANYNARYESAVRTLNASQMWTPIVSSCCAETPPEDCWKKKLPGLERAVNERLVIERKGPAALTPGSSGAGAPVSGTGRSGDR